MATTTTPTYQTYTKWFFIPTFFNFFTNLFTLPTKTLSQAVVVRRASSRVYSNNDDANTDDDADDVLSDYTTNPRVSVEMAPLETIHTNITNTTNSRVSSGSTIVIILPEDISTSRIPLDTSPEDATNSSVLSFNETPNSIVSFDTLPEGTTISSVSLDILSDDTTNSRVSFDTPSLDTVNSRVSSNNINMPATPSFNLEQAKCVATFVRFKKFSQLQAFGDTEYVLATLGTHSCNGVPGDDDDLLDRRKAFGCNKYSKISSASPKKLVRHYLSRSCKDVILYASFFLSFGVRVCNQQQGWKEGGYMLLIASAYSILSSILDFRVNKYLDNAIHLITTSLFDCFVVPVLRNGTEQLISAVQLVVGDVIILNPGQEVHADGLLIHHEQQLSVIEWDQVCNGYNNSIEVNQNLNPFLFAGSVVTTTGPAKMVVTAVGTNTRMWEVQAGSTSIKHSTKLQVRVQALISVMKKVNSAVSMVVLIVMLVRYFSGNSRNEQGVREFDAGKTIISTVLYMLTRIILFTVTIQLALVSESYFWAVKICHGYMMKKMADHGILVQKLSALDKMGSVTSVVVTDRTGELIDQTHLREQFEKMGVKVEIVKSGDSVVLSTIEILKQRGDIVAILTLDNDENVDPLALKQADVRVFMSSANQRHSITKAGSYDTYILKFDEFPNSVFEIFMWGRCALDNTRKLIHFQLTAGIVTLLNGFIYVVSQKQTPGVDDRLVYSLLQLVWVNLILGLLAAIAFSREKPQFKTRRVDYTEPLIYNCMWRNIATQVVYQTVIIQVLLLKGEKLFGLDYMRTDTMSFLVFFSCQVINMFNARKVEEKNVFKGILKNRVFMMIIVAIVVMQMVFVEILHKVVEIIRLDWKQRLQCVGLSFGSLVVGALSKFLSVQINHFRHQILGCGCFWTPN